MGWPQFVLIDRSTSSVIDTIFPINLHHRPPSSATATVVAPVAIVVAAVSRDSARSTRPEVDFIGDVRPRVSFLTRLTDVATKNRGNKALSASGRQ
ncbi:hypothetical protein LSAT2_018659 [Lamellibrachia satsuma]|nr:hypothetical protein LSAT2_018659 [Lamellibrachia satsuma]